MPRCHPEQENTPVRVFSRRTFQNLQQIADFEKSKRLSVLRICDKVGYTALDSALRAPSFGRIRLRKQYSIVCSAQDDTFGDTRFSCL